ncbi:hypothetical protein BABINDRAFT_159575 [Babjeviella inositovora NRRL Y-12698]|uniref:Kinesin-like protein n=1 Tax=Babjeviella inositovora NRRL Y-12698 TaxID=984486 RepID=A0A1E3QZS0_9ASCO|nr:uncharacterized protein BABINDRAFT_159575 [Babjeviella inositovora NRRL Y-12698]ODQ83121.1 hypothetical protein BABINDRAFT_159575 [Babjeviella inositovora NRRL Y-12698]
MSELVNINVVVRCRGRNDREANAKSPVVVSVPDTTGSNEVTLNSSSDTSIIGAISSKMYTVDQVYGPSADQELLFQGVADPLFREFLNGYNCTILAYGQTGTGKTHTMCGNSNILADGQLSGDAGIIPRVLYELFNHMGKDDYVVKCSFLELYNEELKDLLGDATNKLKLRIFESKEPRKLASAETADTTKNTIMIQNLEEVYLKNANHGMNVLRRGLKLRQVASTKMNDFSSRSHTIFTLSLYKSVNNQEYRVAKLNLVDLAGSENVSRSGAVHQRAREAGLINQSLLTLGRVINSLVDGGAHIPYRESKLTRLLQDSIGGKTKTVLIATISPAKVNAEETSSTLEYASKAKNIKNKPQVGALVAKNILLKDMADELSKMKMDLVASRNKQGVYLDNENYQELVNDLANCQTEVGEVKRRNDFLQAQHKTTLESLHRLTKDVESLKRVNTDLVSQMNRLHDKVEKQKLNESRLLNSSKKFKGIICTINNDLVGLIENHHSTLDFLKLVIQGNVSSQISMVGGILESQLLNHDIEGNLLLLKSQIHEVTVKLQNSANRTCKIVTDAFLDKFPRLLQGLRASADEALDVALISESLSLQFDALDQNYQSFEKYVTSDVVSGVVQKQHMETILKVEMQKLEAHQVRLLSKMQDQYKQQNNELIETILSSQESFLANHRQALGAETMAWKEKHSAAVSLGRETAACLLNKMQAEKLKLSSVLDSASSLTDESRNAIIDDLNSLTNSISCLQSEDLLTSFGEIKSKHDAAVSRNLALTDALNTVSDGLGNLQGQNITLVECSMKLRVPNIDEINAAIDILNKEEEEVQTGSIPTGKTPLRIASFPRSSHGSPRRSPLKLHSSPLKQITNAINLKRQRIALDEGDEEMEFSKVFPLSQERGKHPEQENVIYETAPEGKHKRTSSMMSSSVSLTHPENESQEPARWISPGQKTIRSSLGQRAIRLPQLPK